MKKSSPNNSGVIVNGGKVKTAIGQQTNNPRTSSNNYGCATGKYGEVNVKKQQNFGGGATYNGTSSGTK